jgi:hypothetical protein
VKKNKEHTLIKMLVVAPPFPVTMESSAARHSLFNAINDDIHGTN